MPKPTAIGYSPDDDGGRDSEAEEGTPDISELGTAHLVAYEVQAQVRAEREAWARAHEREAAHLRQEATWVQDAERELAALERERERLWHVPFGRMTPADGWRIGELLRLIDERRWRLRDASAQVADWIARAQQHEGAAATLRRLNAGERVREGGMS
jgi:hypothetical protein